MTELFLVSEIAGRTVAVAAGAIDAAVDLGEVVTAPCAPASVRGLAALRSRVVTVIDTALALGLSPMAASARRAVTARIDGHDYGFLVDTLEDVAVFERRPLSNGVALVGEWRAATVGLIERDGEPVPIVDFAVLVPRMADAA